MNYTLGQRLSLVLCTATSEVWGKIWPVRICVHFALMRGRAKRFWLYNPTPWGVIISKLQTRNWLLPGSHCPGPRLNCSVAGRLFFWLQMADPSLARQAKEEEHPERWCQLQKGHRRVSRGWMYRAKSIQNPTQGTKEGGKLGSGLCFLGFQPKDWHRALTHSENLLNKETPKLPLQTNSLTCQLSSLQMWVT